MYKYKIKIVAALLLMFLGACDKGFEEMNIDPNNPVAVPTAHLFTSAQRSLVQSIYGNHDQLGGVSTDINVFIQYWTPLRGGGSGIYQNVEDDFSSFYTEGLADLNEIIRLNSDEVTAIQAAEWGGNNNQIAVARILRAWAFQNITDVWGDVPYSDALQGTAVTLPEYTPQAQIYTDLIEELDAATEQIDLTEPGIKGDIVYNGNMQNWKLFAQSLKLRLGMRMSEADPAAAQKAVSEAYTTGVLNRIDQNALYKYLTSAPNNNPWYYHFSIRVPAYGVTNTLTDKLLALNDPRLAFYADTAQLGGGYIGRQFGLDVASANSQRDDATSWPNHEHVVSATTPFVILSYDEVMFTLAEAAARDWIGGEAETFYKEAITASMQYWGVSEPDILAYLEQPAIAYSQDKSLELIGNQKWIALYNRSVEAWSEWRRLDYPTLLSASQAFAGRNLPRRRGYPAAEISLNQKNYNLAIARQGPDELSTRVWWDK